MHCFAKGKKRGEKKETQLDISDFDEAALRFFVMVAIKRRYRKAKCQSEWHRIDLVATIPDNKKIAIEFKFYVLRKTWPLGQGNSEKPHWKGGASEQNRRDFDKCIRKLQKLSYKEIDEKYVVLIYDRRKHGRKTSFEKFYGNLKKEFGKNAIETRNCWGNNDVASWLIRIP